MEEKERFWHFKCSTWVSEEEQWADNGSSGGGKRGWGWVQSSHQQAAMTACHSCQGLCDIFCQGKPNSSSFCPNRTVRPWEQGGDVVSLKRCSLFKTAALRLPLARSPKAHQRDTHRPTQKRHDRLHRNASTRSVAAALKLKKAPRPEVCSIRCNL